MENPAPTVVPQDNNDDIIIEDEDVPLAAAPKTGDISMIWIAMALAAAITLCAANFGKKRENEAFW